MTTNADKIEKPLSARLSLLNPSSAQLMQTGPKPLEMPFHGDNTGSNPVGDAKLGQLLSSGFAFHS
jgi:hypothetical protein